MLLFIQRVHRTPCTAGLCFVFMQLFTPGDLSSEKLDTAAGGVKGKVPSSRTQCCCRATRRVLFSLFTLFFQQMCWFRISGGQSPAVPWGPTVKGFQTLYSQQVGSDFAAHSWWSFGAFCCAWANCQHVIGNVSYVLISHLLLCVSRAKVQLEVTFTVSDAS